MTAARKVPPYEIRQIANSDPEFYELVGPFLSRREIVDELGAPVWDEDDKSWLVAVREANEVIGFVSVKPSASRLQIRSLYVLPEFRGDVIGAALVIRVLALWPGTVEASATPASVELFGDCGFTETGKRGRFTRFLLERDTANAVE